MKTQVMTAGDPVEIRKKALRKMSSQFYRLANLPCTIAASLSQTPHEILKRFK
jgi:hypothetical protein